MNYRRTICSSGGERAGDGTAIQVHSYNNQVVLFHERNEEEEISHAMTLIMEVELRLLFMRYRKRSSISLLPDLYLEASSQSQLPKTNFLSRSCHLQKRVGVSSSCSFFYLKKKKFLFKQGGYYFGQSEPHRKLSLNDTTAFSNFLGTTRE